MKTSAEIRQGFFDYFKNRDHAIVASSSLIPANDPTLLFTNAGMVQFKEVFLGNEQRHYQRAVTSQRCVRAGGKHNDLENVGYTSRHHTFFEMLGNFSFGDYFKRDAIKYAWEFLTEYAQLPRERLWVTVFTDDDEATDIWLNDIGVEPQRFTRIGAKDNFWSMGETGPCGPCSEIFYDHGPEIAGGPPGSPDADGDRFVEIWNLVFMQYNRDANGKLHPLPKPSVDTGMGLERLAAVKQGVQSNYDIDLFQALIQAVAKIIGCSDSKQASLRVIADHIRASAFLVVDGVYPSNEGRGYVLRRIIRRAVRHAYQLNMKTSFFYKLVAPLCQQMGAAYPELVKAQSNVERVLKLEEERFAQTLEQGMKILDDDISTLSGGIIPGQTIFRLYDTYGFPVDLTADIARERGLTMDLKGFDVAMAQQRNRARAASKFGGPNAHSLTDETTTEFTGYQCLEDQTQVIALYIDSQKVQQLEAGQSGTVILAQTPFYGESGGQAGDTGLLHNDGMKFEITNTHKSGAGVISHTGTLVAGSLALNDDLIATVNSDLRQAIVLNHSATHMLHAALRKVLGDHVEQKGSLVDGQRLRFDFSHMQPVKPDELLAITNLVNDHIRQNHPLQTQIMELQDAMDAGAMALFGEKYAEQVRVVRIGDFSTELCGGTHAERAGDIGFFTITSETGIASGIRRIEALTGAMAMQWAQKNDAQLMQIATLIKADRENIADKVRNLYDRNHQLEKDIDKLKGKLASTLGGDLTTMAQDINGLKVLAAKLEGVDAKSLRDTVDQLKNKLGSAVVVLSTVSGGKVSLVAGVTKDATARIKAGELVNMVAQQVGGRGGGRPDMAQAGGDDPTKLDDALASVTNWVEKKLM